MVVKEILSQWAANDVPRTNEKDPMSLRHTGIIVRSRMAVESSSARRGIPGSGDIEQIFPPVQIVSGDNLPDQSWLVWRIIEKTLEGAARMFEAAWAGPAFRNAV
jgi:hypothetical protein